MFDREPVRIAGLITIQKNYILTIALMQDAMFAYLSFSCVFEFIYIDKSTTPSLLVSRSKILCDSRILTRLFKRRKFK